MCVHESDILDTSDYTEIDGTNMELRVTALAPPPFTHRPPMVQERVISFGLHSSEQESSQLKRARATFWEKFGEW